MGPIHFVVIAVVAFVAILLLTQWVKRRRIQRLTNPNRDLYRRRRSHRH